MYCPYEDSTREILSNIRFCVWEFPQALPSGTTSGEGLYLLFRHNTDTVKQLLVRNKRIHIFS